MTQMQQQHARLMSETVAALQTEQAEQMRALKQEMTAESGRAMAAKYSIATPEKDPRDNRFPLANVHTLSAPTDSASAASLGYASRSGTTKTITLTSRLAEEQEQGEKRKPEPSKDAPSRPSGSPGGDGNPSDSGDDHKKKKDKKEKK